MTHFGVCRLIGRRVCRRSARTRLWRGVPVFEEEINTASIVFHCVLECVLRCMSAAKLSMYPALVRSGCHHWSCWFTDDAAAKIHEWSPTTACCSRQRLRPAHVMPRSMLEFLALFLSHVKPNRPRSSFGAILHTSNIWRRGTNYRLRLTQLCGVAGRAASPKAFRVLLACCALPRSSLRIVTTSRVVERSMPGPGCSHSAAGSDGFCYSRLTR